MKLNLPKKKVFMGPAMLWKRILALIVDLFVLDFFVLSMFSGAAAKILGGANSIREIISVLESNPGQVQVLTALFAVIVLLAMSYFVLLQYATGQTLGCMLLNIYIVNGDGERPKFWQGIVRNMFVIPAFPFILLWVADPVYLFFAKKGQRLTEWLSDTRVVEQFEL
jgi:uncharacterized RDD family membrane protein YckC